MFSISVLMVIATAVLMFLAGSTIAVVVLCLRAPLRNDLDDSDTGKLIAPERRGRATYKQVATTRSQRKHPGNARLHHQRDASRAIPATPHTTN